MVQIYNPNVVGKQILIDVRNIEHDRLKTVEMGSYNFFPPFGKTGKSHFSQLSHFPLFPLFLFPLSELPL